MVQGYQLRNSNVNYNNHYLSIFKNDIYFWIYNNNKVN